MPSVRAAVGPQVKRVLLPAAATRLTSWTLIFMAVLMCGVCFAEEDGIDVFLKAVISQQTQSKIFSGQGTYDMSKGLAKTEEEIQEEIDYEIAKMKQMIPNHPQLKNIIEGYPKAVRARYAEKCVFSGAFRFDYSQKDWHYIENQMIYDGDSERPVTVIEKRDARKLTAPVDAAMFDPSISQVMVNNTRSSVAEFNQFGRVRGMMVYLISAVVKEKGERLAREEIKEKTKKISGDKEGVTVMKITEKKPFDNGATAYTIESSAAGQVSQRYVIVPALGYICPKIEYYDPQTGGLFQEYEASDFVLHQRSGLYYPTRYRETVYDPSTGRMRENKEYTIHQETLSLNETMSPKDFFIEVPEGLRVVDNRVGNEEYIAEASGVLTLEPDGLALDKKTWLRKTIAAPPNIYTTYYKNALPRILLMALGVVLIVFALARRRRNKSPRRPEEPSVSQGE